MEKTWQLYINGHWVSAQSGQTFAVVNPATQDVIAQVPDGGPPRRMRRWRRRRARRTGRGCPGENEASSSLMRIS